MMTFTLRFSAAVDAAGLERPDVVVGSSVHPFAALAAERYARKGRIPFCFEVRDLWPQTLIDLGAYRRWHPFIVLLGWIERHLYSSASQIITLLPGAGEYIAQKGVSPNKITWIPNGIDFSMLRAATPPREQRPFVISYAGSLGLANGIESLLNAAGALQESGWADRVVFRIIGAGPDKDRLMERAAREGLSNVCFPPPVPKSEVYSELMKADAFFLYIADSALYRWGFSMNKLFDYLACARPILLLANAKYNPVAEAEAGLTVHPNNRVATVAAIKRLVEMPLEERRQMGSNARCFAEQHHDLEKLGEKFEKVLLKATTPVREYEMSLG